MGWDGDGERETGDWVPMPWIRDLGIGITNYNGALSDRFLHCVPERSEVKQKQGWISLWL